MSERLVANIVPMTASQVRALVDAQYALAHPDLLASAQIELYCRYCVATGATGEVRSEVADAVTNFVCAHTQGWVKKGRTLTMEQFLAASGMDLRCARCQENVHAENAPTDPVFLVMCPCTIRQLANPAAHRPSVARMDGRERL